jgi:hypothetical protein
MPETPGGLLGRLDTLGHRWGWLPRWATRPLCDLMDRRMGMGWAEIRASRRGRQPGSANDLDPPLQEDCAMSYSIGTGVIPANEIRRNVEAQLAKNEHLGDEARAAVELAVQAAEHLRDAVGGSHLYVTISGHANPGHEPPEGWSRDQVLVSVTNALPPKQREG